MPGIVFLLADGSAREIAANEGSSLMLTAIQNGVDGIEGECGGCLDCATCHVYVSEDWLQRLAPPSSSEDELLNATSAERRPNSRLGCQIRLTASLDGMMVQVPARSS